jgi:hypothetical protein
VLTRVSLCDESWAEARLEADTAVRLFIAAADGDRRTFEEAQLMKPLRSRWSSGRVAEWSSVLSCRSVGRPRLPMTMTNQSQRALLAAGAQAADAFIHYSSMHLALILGETSSAHRSN